jgi:hypothetical protein
MVIVYHQPCCNIEFISKMSGRDTYRPDFKVNSPKSKTPFFNAASMNATFSASTAVVEDLATLIVYL